MNVLNGAQVRVNSHNDCAHEVVGQQLQLSARALVQWFRSVCFTGTRSTQHKATLTSDSHVD